MEYVKKYIPTFIYALLQKARHLIIILIYKIGAMRSLKNQVICYSNSEQLRGNIKAIYDELTLKKEFIPFIKKGIFKKIKFVFKISISKYVIVDDYVPLLYGIKFRKNAKFIQIWHAGGAFKRVGFSRINKEGGPKKSSITHKNYTDVIVSSTNIVDLYSKSFQIDKNKIKPLGLPRTDQFFKKGNHKINKNKKIILYAPTFRGNGEKTAIFDLNIIDYKSIYDNFNDEYVFLIHLHPFIKSKIAIEDKYKDFFKDISLEYDINDVLPTVDILITDYSSIIFEYLYFKKPLVLFVPDLNDYIDKRDFYFDFESYNYGTIAKNNEQLIEALKKPVCNLKRIKDIKEFHMNACNGNSTSRIINEIIGV